MLNKKKKSLSLSFWASITATVMVVIWPFMETATMGADVMKQFVIVCMQHIRGVQLTRFFPRSELIMINLFVWSVYIQSAIMLFCCIYSAKQVIKIKKEWHLSVPLTAILLVITYYLGFDHNKFADFLAYLWPQAVAALSIGLPTILLIASFFGKRKVKT